jgi:conjugative relaxase-like TrwC/TraI family protein
VLTIGKLGTGQEAYYLDSVAGGIEDYYAGEGEAPGRWLGSGSRDLGLEGEVERAHLRRILAAEHPKTGRALAGRRGGLRVPGFDLTLSAPKSVSLLWALGDAETRQAVRECHDRAVDAALGYMERQAAWVRRGAGGTEGRRAHGLIGAAFRHRCSRAGDPQLHTHVLIANLVRGLDGRHSALDGTRVYRHAKSGGYLYQAQLRYELTRALGVTFQPIRRGAAEIEGAADEVLRGFSRRRAEIERALAERGLQSRQAARVAAVDSRRAKEQSVGAETLHARWRGRAAELGADLSRWSVGPRSIADSAIDRRELALWVTADRSHFDRRDVIQAICDGAPAGMTVERVERVADAFLASREVVQLSDTRFGPRYTTPEILALEHGVLEAVERLRNRGVGTVRSEILQRSLERRPLIATDQSEMVRHLTSDGDGVAVVVGRPGTGKTYALNAATEAWSAAGLNVRGATPTRAAAAALESAAGIPSVSVAAVLAELDDRAANGFGLTALPTGGVLVVDEAAMVGTRSIARLLHHVEAAEGKLVLVGDHRQLPELEAGGLFRALIARTRPIELREVHRHTHGLDRENVERIRQGRGAEAFELYRSEDRVVAAPDADTRRRSMVADWWRAFGKGEDAIMIAKRNADVAELNHEARGVMETAGALGEREVEVAGKAFAAGDIVVTRVNSTAHGVANRMRWQISNVEADGLIELKRLDSGARASLDSSYLERFNPQSGAPALQHGYAGTIYTAQGQSVQRALVAAEAAMSLEEFNTALSRSVGETHLYAVAVPEVEREEFAPREQGHRDPLDELVESMERSDGQLAAIDEARQAPLRELPSAELVARSETLRREILVQRRGAMDRKGARKTAPRADLSEPRADLAAIDAELAERRRLTISAARLSPPLYVREAIGERPDDAQGRHRWEQGLQEIERYRQMHSVTDRHRALGIEPGSGFAQAAYERVVHRVARVQRELSRTAPAHELDHSLDISV